MKIIAHILIFRERFFQQMNIPLPLISLTEIDGKTHSKPNRAFICKNSNYKYKTGNNNCRRNDLLKYRYEESSNETTLQLP